ncbi:MAG TPA: phosphatidylglycerol lysyltransferase domain-containing protein [Thermoleophilaceae bacterium]|nr:phosphatidylglycerol lysyltransferase domain-containing protein [Thermoleophilaceae bacterium]
MIRIDKHELGPRLYVAGRRIHEWHAGLALLALPVVIPPLRWSIAGWTLALIGAWLFVKDWHDLFPSRRDTAAWRLAPHRPPRPLRRVRRGDWLPSFAGWLAALAGVINIASVLSPEGPAASAITPVAHGRGDLLLSVLPEAIPHAADALALPAGAALLVIARQLTQRRRRALTMALVVLLAAGLLNLLKGLDVAEAVVCFSAAGVLYAGREAFCVGPQDGPVAASRQAALAALASLGVALATLFAASHWAHPATTPGRAVSELVARAAWQNGPLHYNDPFAWVPAGIDAILAFGLLGIAYIVFRPLAHPRDFPGPAARRLAARIVREHGRDTLSAFKLRPDTHYFFASDRRAMIGYAVEGRRLVIAGDPIGPPESVRMLMRELGGFAELRGLRLAGVGASAGFGELARQAGLRSFYIGDEAIIDTGEFSLDGRAIRKVRQAVRRIEREGYSAELAEVGDLDRGTLSGLEQLVERWRGDDVERGFSMATVTLLDEQMEDSFLLVARDAGGAPAGLLHFVRCYGHPAVSLGLMRRDRSTPNGLTEFMVVSAVEALRGRGIEEVSLNFAPFARLIHGPACPSERILGQLASTADRFFQVERLYRFNAKFHPRWEPRYLLYEGLLGLPSAGLAVMWVERQLPKPSLARRPG